MKLKQVTTKKWYIINDLSNGVYKAASTIKFETKVIKPNLCDYSDAYILVTGDITAGNAANARVAFKNCASFERCVLQINDEHVEDAENLNVVMPMYNLLESSDNYEESSGSQFKRDEQNLTANGNIADVKTANSTLFKYKSDLLDATDAESKLKKCENRSAFKILK